jgi:predicted small lipoprotein YifL
MPLLRFKLNKCLSAVIVLLPLFVLAACGQNQTESLQGGPLNLNNNQEFETTEEGYLPIKNNGPRTIDQTNNSPNQTSRAGDKQTIREAAENVPGVEVTSITFDDKIARVRVNVDQSLNNDERIAWSNNIKSAIEGAINRYNIQVIVNKK